MGSTHLPIDKAEDWQGLPWGEARALELLGLQLAVLGRDPPLLQGVKFGLGEMEEGHGVCPQTSEATS